MRDYYFSSPGPGNRKENTTALLPQNHLGQETWNGRRAGIWNHLQSATARFGLMQKVESKESSFALYGVGSALFCGPHLHVVVGH